MTKYLVGSSLIGRLKIRTQKLHPNGVSLDIYVTLKKEFKYNKIFNINNIVLC
jgi:hypothetical protein